MATLEFPTLTADAQMELNEIVHIEAISDGEINRLFNLLAVKSGDRLAYMNPLSMIGKKSRGCTPATDTASADMIEKKWALAQWDARTADCFEDYQTNLYNFGLKNGVEEADLTGTPLANMMADKFGEAISVTMQRMIWFGQKTPTQLKSGVDKEYFNICDGIFQQVNTMITNDNGIYHKVITENTPTGESGSQTIPELTDAYSILKDVVLNAPIQLKRAAADDKVVYVTDAFMTALKKQILSENIATESQFIQREDGIEQLKLFGLIIEAMPLMDSIISANYETSTGSGLPVDPYRVLYTTRTNLNVGVPSLDNFEKMETWYEKKDRKVYTDIMDRLDVIVGLDKMVSAAW